MFIPYRAVYTLLETRYTRRSLNTIIDESDNFQGSITTAHIIEDYRYLDAMVTKKNQISSELVFFFDERDRLPIALKLNQDLDLTSFAILCVDCNTIRDEFFIDAIENECDNLNDGLVEEKINEFKAVVSSVRKLKKDLSRKIQNNEPCPCQSGEKYKNCCKVH